MPTMNKRLALAMHMELELMECHKCSVPYGITVEFVARRREDHETFYCPNGHPAYYPQDNETERLRKKVANLEDDARVARLDAERAKREAARLKKRAQGGACPCCNRTFVQLSRHMKTKHPDHATG